MPPALALYEPEIPANAGNIARLCAATGADLHLIGRLGFSLRHPEAKRAGMDYWERVTVHRHLNFADFARARAGGIVWAFTTRAARSFWEPDIGPADTLLFGPESRGLPSDLLDHLAPTTLRIPMKPDARSLNLATAAGIALYEAIRRSGFPADLA